MAGVKEYYIKEAKAVVGDILRRYDVGEKGPIMREEEWMDKKPPPPPPDGFLYTHLICIHNIV